MYTQIGHMIPRSERGEWQAKLKAPLELNPRKRDLVLDAKILRGDLEDAVRTFVLHEEKRIVSFLLSSTFTDTESERNLLIADVVPYLHEYARQRGFEFRLAEMRWGIRKEASSAHQTSEICMAELERCQRESQGFSYVFLGCQKYGFRPFPAKIPEDIFKKVLDVMEPKEKELAQEYYQLDTNVHFDSNVPPAPADLTNNLNEWHYGAADSGAGPVYVLKSSEGVEDWWSTFEKLQVAFRAAARKVWKDKVHLLRDPSSKAFIKKFFISVTEEEFSRGLLWLTAEDQRSTTIVFKRVITDLASHATVAAAEAAAAADKAAAEAAALQKAEEDAAAAEAAAKQAAEAAAEAADKAAADAAAKKSAEEGFSEALRIAQDAGDAAAKQKVEEEAAAAKKAVDETAAASAQAAADALAKKAAEEEAKKFIDMQGTSGKELVDEEAQKLLQEQMQMVPKHVQTITYEPIPWGPGIQHSNAQHAAYLRKFLDDFCEIMMKSIEAGAQKLAVEADDVAEEATQHLRFALIRAGKFTSTASTKEVESAAASYLNVTHTDGAASGGDGLKVGKALVIYGRSGAGKTYLVSKIMAQCLESRSAGGAVVIRFLGTTPRSSNVHALLTSLCEQLKRLYGKDDAVPSDFKELRVYFHLALTQWPTAEHPLTLFIDSVDQLDDSNAGRRLDWLPVTGLPAHVKLVVSTLPDYPGLFQCLSTLQDKLGESNALSTAGDSSRHCVEVKTISEPEAVLTHLLHLQGRKLTDDQRKHVLEAFEKRTDADAAGTPLWLTIVAFEVSLWPSFGEQHKDKPSSIRPAVRDLIISLFERLEKAHGKELVDAALAYITLAKNGVSETELQHLLSLEDSVLASVYQWWVPPVRIAPPLLVTRLLTDLAPFLTRRGDGSGSELVSWYHRQFWEAAEARLFPTENGEAIKQQRHKELADYFEGTWAGKCKPYSPELQKSVQRPEFFPGEAAAERNVPHQPLVLEGDLFDPKSKYTLNTRRIHELVHHLIASKQVDRAVRELTSAAYIAAKFALKDGAVLMRQYADAQRAFTAVSPTTAADLGKCKATVGRFLKHLERFPPLLALQMCVQEPDQHPLCIAAKSLLERASDTHGSRELRPRVVEWTNKHQELDPCQLEIKEHEGPVNSVAYFPDSGDGNEARIVSASEDGTVKITSAVSGEVVLELQGHTGPVNGVAVSKDGKRVASGGEDKTVRVWDAQTGKELGVFSGHSGYVTAVSYFFLFSDVWCVLTIEHFTGLSIVLASAHMASRLPVAVATRASRFGTQTPATACRR
jgi:hypothetical protein